MEPMTIALIVLVVVAVWAAVELALTLRRARKSVEEVTESLNDTIGEVRPVIAKLDGAADELVPASKQLEPILKKASTSVDLLNVDLVRVEGILSDVNTVTGTGARVTDAVTGAVDAAATGVAGVAAKVAGRVGGSKAAKLDGAEPAHLEAPANAEGTPVVERVSGDAGYFTYPVAADGSAVPAGRDALGEAAPAGTGAAVPTAQGGEVTSTASPVAGPDRSASATDSNE